MDAVEKRRLLEIGVQLEQGGKQSVSTVVHKQLGTIPKPNPSKHGTGRWVLMCRNVQKMHDALSGQQLPNGGTDILRRVGTSAFVAKVSIKGRIVGRSKGRELWRE